MTGSHATYNVGPGQAHTECGTVPWGNLVAGDVVNIFHRSTPYKCKFGLSSRGTQTNKIVINGVTDSFGNRPILEFNGARTAAGCNQGPPNNVFGGSYDFESLGGIVIKRFAGSAWESPKPQHIVIQNLEMKGAANGQTYTKLDGAEGKYDSSAGIWIQVGADITLQNNIITNNGFGVFTMAKDGTLAHTVERPVIRCNRIHGNGVANSYLEHNLYVQSTSPLVEGNYIGQVRKDSWGASYKTRSSGEIFRYNYVVASARALDFVHSEGNEDGIAIQPDYGTDYVYGNIIYNDCIANSNCASNPIHYGGDNMGEQDSSSAVFTPPIPYRSRLYFFGNTVINRANTDDSWRVHMFDLSLASTTVYAWNNIFANFGNSNFAWVEYAGRLNLHGKNLVYGTMLNHHDFANPIHVRINQLGTLVNGDPKFVDLANEDFSLQVTSPAINQAGGIPSGLPNNLSVHPVLNQPISGLNGMITRTVTGAAPDLGALEQGVP